MYGIFTTIVLFRGYFIGILKNLDIRVKIGSIFGIMKDELRGIPSIDKLIKNECFNGYPHKFVREVLRNSTDKWREKIKSGDIKKGLDIERAIIEETCSELSRSSFNNLRRVINGTGVILNTNLGRSPISGDILEAFTGVGSSYSNLEFELKTGERGDRHFHIEELLRKLTGTEDAIVVNNNAAAVLLILNTFAKKKEVIVSRGELIEIGGSFRLPDILAKSECKLVEVGTTNRTYLEDYEGKITPRTAMFFKAHTSNYKIMGFTETPLLKELVKLGKKHNIITVEDLGSGLMVDLRDYKLPYEPTVKDVLASGADLVSFSGDKLLGGSQCGIVIGKKEYVSKLKKNPLFRALRVGKLTLSCLESVLRVYLYDDEPASKIPILSMIKETPDSVKMRAKRLHNELNKVLREEYHLKIEPSEAEIGGGSCPGLRIPSFAVTISSPKHSPSFISERLRGCEPPIISRVAGNRVWLDARTIFDEDIVSIVKGTKKWL